MSFFNKTNQDAPRTSSPLEMIRAAVGISSQKNSFVEDEQVIRDKVSRNLEDSDDEFQIQVLDFSDQSSDENLDEQTEKIEKRANLLGEAL